MIRNAIGLSECQHNQPKIPASGNLSHVIYFKRICKELMAVTCMDWKTAESSGICMELFSQKPQQLFNHTASLSGTVCRKLCSAPASQFQNEI